MRPGEGRALQARCGGEGGEASGVLDSSVRETGQDPGDAKSVAAYVPIAPASANLGHQIHRAVSPRCGACWRGIWAGATSTKMARNKDEREEIESRRAGRERPSAVDVGRGGPYCAVHVPALQVQAARGRCGWLGLARRPLKPPVLQWQGR